MYTPAIALEYGCKVSATHGGDLSMPVIVLHQNAYRGELSSPAEAGREFTHLALLDVGAGSPIRAYVKLYPAAYADGSPSRGLVNELVGHFFSCRAGLPTPKQAGLLVLDPSRLSRSPVWIDRSKPILGWWSEDVGSKSLRATLNIDALPEGSQARIQACLEAKDFLLRHAETSAVVALDDLIANVDRNLGNILLGPNSITLIDHGQTLTGPSWVAEELSPQLLYPNKIRALLGPDYEALPFKSRVMADYSSISAAVSTALPDLKPWLERLLPPSDAVSAHDFIQQRTDLGLAARRIGVVA